MDWRTIKTDKEKYAAYLCSREWSVLREAVRKRSGGKCERCGINEMDACHHLTYERKYAERLEDLQAICNPCHDFTHGKSNEDPATCNNLSNRKWIPSAFVGLLVNVANCKIDKRDGWVGFKNESEETEESLPGVEVSIHKGQWWIAFLGTDGSACGAKIDIGNARSLAQWILDKFPE